MQASARLSSAAASRKVIAGVSSATTRSCYWTSRGKAHAVPLSAQKLPQKGQKSITKQERKVRIKEFVESYRASNDGKFPTMTSTRQQVGGSYYTVREVLQEMEHKLRMKDLTDKPDPGNQQREIEAKKFDLKNPEKTLDVNDSNASDQTGSAIVNEGGSDIVNEGGSDIMNEAKTHARDDNPKHDESTNTGLLGSLKSFAYGIRNFWKNM